MKVRCRQNGTKRNTAVKESNRQYDKQWKREIVCTTRSDENFVSSRQVAKSQSRKAHGSACSVKDLTPRFNKLISRACKLRHQTARQPEMLVTGSVHTDILCFRQRAPAPTQRLCGSAQALQQAGPFGGVETLEPICYIAVTGDQVAQSFFAAEDSNVCATAYLHKIPPSSTHRRSSTRAH